jgi:hypothetical protein
MTLRNGDFEEGTAAWQESSSKSLRLILQREELGGVIPHSGEWLAWLGGKSDELSVLSQTVTVPPEQPYLTYWKSIGAPPDCSRDVASVIVNTIQLIDQFSLCVQDAQAWVPHTVDLSLYAGTTITLQFRVDITLNSFPSSLYLDDIQWNAAAAITQSAQIRPIQGQSQQGQSQQGQSQQDHWTVDSAEDTIATGFAADLPLVSRFMGKESKLQE